MSVGVVGAGYVGLTTAVCLAERDHDTVCIDIDSDRVQQLNSGVVTLDEPGLPQLLEAGLRSGRLRFSADHRILADRDVVFVCVPTPSGADGSADLSSVDRAVRALAETLRPGAVVVLKSTVPVGTARAVATKLDGTGIRVVSNPEFLRESHAVYDFRHPDRILIGATDDAAADTVARLYGAGEGEALRMSPESAELSKYASNAFLAVKISYTNSLAQLCSRVGADMGTSPDAWAPTSASGGTFCSPVRVGAGRVCPRTPRRWCTPAGATGWICRRCHPRARPTSRRPIASPQP